MMAQRSGVRVAVAAVVGLGACVSSDPLRPGATGPEIPIYQVENVIRSDWILDPYWIRGVTLDDHRLTLDVQYGGGCREHTFVLVFGPDPTLALWTRPPRMVAVLGHDGQHDPCEAALTAALQADLSAIAAAVDTSAFDLIILPPDENGDTLTVAVGPGRQAVP